MRFFRRREVGPAWTCAGFRHGLLVAVALTIGCSGQTASSGVAEAPSPPAEVREGLSRVDESVSATQTDAGSATRAQEEEASAGSIVPTTAGAASDAVPAAVAAAAFYSEPQAHRGQRAFRQVCSECHYTSEFRGRVFTDVWQRRTARDLYRELRRTMPDDNPGGLPRRVYADVIAYILELNGYPSGPDDLPTDEEVLRSFRLTPPG